jgi:(1->4)-alpha-D-glucan 1-alpha-D-glucosylmutase
LVPRLQAYLIKATREAKRATSWMTPNADYEDGTTAFAARLLENPEQNAFLRDFTSFAEIVRYFGHLNSIAQTVLKLTSPGIPDTYQGTEVVALALVDPDNRRSVNYEANAEALDEIESIANTTDGASRLAEAFSKPQANTAKLFVTWRLLQLRRELADLFAQGDYESLNVSGAAKEHVLAFSRTHGNTSVIVVLAKWMAQLMKGERVLPVGEVWGDTAIALARPHASMRDVFTNTSAEAGEGNQLLASNVFETLPAAVFVAQRTS